MLLMLTGKRSRREWSVVLLLCLVSCVVQRSSQLVFRFCHRGVWHQLLEGECPHGMLFNEQLHTPCWYSTTRGMGRDNNSVMRIWPSLCDEPSMSKVGMVGDASSEEGMLVAHKNAQIRMVELEIDDYDVSNKKQKSEENICLQSCEDRCYRHGFEDPIVSNSPSTSSSHEASDSLEVSRLHNIHPKFTPTNVDTIRDQTVRLGDYLFDQIAYPDDEPGPNLRMADVFKQSIKITEKACPHPFVSSNFLNRVLYGFLFLVGDFGVREMEDLGKEEFEEIMVALSGCDRNKKSPDFRLEGTICERNGIVREVIKILPNGTEFTTPILPTQQSSQKAVSSLFRRDGTLVKGNIPDYDNVGRGDDLLRGQGSFPYDELDIFIEAAWSAVQVTHATCLTNFKPNSNMLHRYVSAMEELFSGKIRDRWRNPTLLQKNQMWATWLMADVDLTFRNLQACIQAAYMDSPFVTRLDRPIDPIRSSFSRDQEVIGRGNERTPSSSNDNEFSQRRKREADTNTNPKHSNSYWDTYTTNGGIRAKLSSEIQCFETLSAKEKAVSLLKVQCKAGTKQ